VNDKNDVNDNNINDFVEEYEIFDIENLNEVSPLSIEQFTQSQSHGLFWDNEIRVHVFGLNKCINDTKKYDIDYFENKFDPNENVSIKTSSNNNIDCADIIRFFNGDFTKKYTIILVRYNQKEQYKCIKEIIEINYTIELRNYLFGTITEEILQEYVNFIKSIPVGKVSDEIKNEYKNKKILLQRLHNMYINISPKLDSKTQRRVQCSIPKIDKLIETFPNIVISRTTEPLVRNIQITSKIFSIARIRNVKKIINFVSNHI
jgi:hypothetical protein